MWSSTRYRRNFEWFSSTIMDYIRVFLDSKSKMRLFILFYLVILVSIKLVLSEYRPDYSDPGGDSALLINGATNILEGKGYTYDSIWMFDKSDGEISTEISKPGYLYPPLTSILLSILFKFTESLFAAIIAQILVLFLCIGLYFEFVSKLFDRKKAFFSSLVVSSNPILIFEVVAIPRTHVLGLFFVILFFFVVYSNFRESYKYYLIGIVAALGYLTRDINLILLISFCFYLFINKKITELSKVLTSFIFITAPWIYRNYTHYGSLNPRATTVGYYYPPAGIPDSYSSFMLLDAESLVTWIAALHQLLFDFSSPYFYFLLFPFLFLGVISKMEERYHFPHIYLIIYSGFLIVMPLVDRDTGINKHYFLPFFMISIPFSIFSFIKVTNQTSSSLGFNSNLVFLVLFTILISSYSSTVIKDELGYKHQTSVYDPLEDYDWAKENFESESNVAIANRLPHRYNYHTGHSAITLPINLDEKTFEDFVLQYNIDYVLIFSDQSNNYDEEDEPYQILFSGTSNYNYNSVELILINEQKSVYDGLAFFVYQVSIT